jgi:hypothetical protein
MKSDISGLLNFPDLKILQVFELDDIFCFCQDVPTFLMVTTSFSAGNDVSSGIAV